MGFPINPPNTPLVDDRGLVTPPWYKYFLAIQRMIGGPSDPFEDGAFLNALPVGPAQPAGDEGLDAPPVQVVVTAADPLTPPVQPVAVADDLSPPPMPFLALDDLLYPPRYGA